MARVQGLDKLRAKLRALPEAVKEEMRKGLAESADEITALQRNIVEVDEGDLRASIDWVWGDAPQGVVFGASKKGTDPESTRGDLRITILAGNEKAFYARYVEFGTRASAVGQRVSSGTGGRRSRIAERTHPGTPARPFFYPAYRALRKRAKSKISRGITKAAKKVAAS